MRKSAAGHNVIEGRYDDPDTGSGIPLLGLSSLLNEMQQQGYPISVVLEGTGIAAEALTSATSNVSQYQKLKLFQNKYPAPV